VWSELLLVALSEYRCLAEAARGTIYRAKRIFSFRFAARAILTSVPTVRFFGEFSIAEIFELGIPALAASFVWVSFSSSRTLAI
jgi:hypothetical protein